MAVAHPDVIFISGVIFFPIAAGVGAFVGGAIWFTVAFSVGGLIVGLTICHLGRKLTWSIFNAGMLLGERMKAWAQQVVCFLVLLFFFIFPVASVGAAAAGTLLASVWLAKHVIADLTGWLEILGGCSATLVSVAAVVHIYRRQVAGAECSTPQLRWRRD
jgi:hypothetical protein